MKSVGSSKRKCRRNNTSHKTPGNALNMDEQETLEDTPVRRFMHASKLGKENLRGFHLPVKPRSPRILNSIEQTEDVALSRQPFGDVVNNALNIKPCINTLLLVDESKRPLLGVQNLAKITADSVGSVTLESNRELMPNGDILPDLSCSPQSTNIAPESSALIDNDFFVENTVHNKDGSLMSEKSLVQPSQYFRRPGRDAKSMVEYSFEEESVASNHRDLSFMSKKSCVQPSHCFRRPKAITKPMVDLSFEDSDESDESEWSFMSEKSFVLPSNRFRRPRTNTNVMIDQSYEEDSTKSNKSDLSFRLGKSYVQPSHFFRRQRANIKSMDLSWGEDTTKPNKSNWSPSSESSQVKPSHCFRRPQADVCSMVDYSCEEDSVKSDHLSFSTDRSVAIARPTLKRPSEKNKILSDFEREVSLRAEDVSFSSETTLIWPKLTLRRSMRNIRRFSINSVEKEETMHVLPETSLDVNGSTCSSQHSPLAQKPALKRKLVREDDRSFGGSLSKEESINGVDDDSSILQCTPAQKPVLKRKDATKYLSDVTYAEKSSLLSQPSNFNVSPTSHTPVRKNCYDLSSSLQNESSNMLQNSGTPESIPVKAKLNRKRDASHLDLTDELSRKDNSSLLHDELGVSSPGHLRIKFKCKNNKERSFSDLSRQNDSTKNISVSQRSIAISERTSLRIALTNKLFRRKNCGKLMPNFSYAESEVSATENSSVVSSEKNSTGDLSESFSSEEDTLKNDQSDSEDLTCTSGISEVKENTKISIVRKNESKEDCSKLNELEIENRNVVENVSPLSVSSESAVYADSLLQNESFKNISGGTPLKGSHNRSKILSKSPDTPSEILSCSSSTTPLQILLAEGSVCTKVTRLKSRGKRGTLPNFSAEITSSAIDCTGSQPATYEKVLLKRRKSRVGTLPSFSLAESEGNEEKDSTLPSEESSDDEDMENKSCSSPEKDVENESSSSWEQDSEKEVSSSLLAEEVQRKESKTEIQENERESLALTLDSNILNSSCGVASVCEQSINETCIPANARTMLRSQAPSDDSDDIIRECIEFVRMYKRKIADEKLKAQTDPMYAMLVKIREENSLKREKERNWADRFAQKPKALAKATTGGKRSHIKLYKPARWANKRLYDYLKKKLLPHYGLNHILQAESVVRVLFDTAKKVIKSKTYEKRAVDRLKKKLAQDKIIVTTYDFYNFVRTFMPNEFELKVIPMVQPFTNIVWPPKDSNLRESDPILK